MGPIALCYGTRPQVIKASVLRRVLCLRWPVITVDTGQHYDHPLNTLLYQQLGIPPADHELEIGSAGHGAQTAGILMRMEALLLDLQPSAMVVIGDTNSTLGSALAACKTGVPVAHVEAGLRARDRRMPEEINRRLVDAIATLLCAPDAETADRLRTERQDGTIVNTGDIALDVLRMTEPGLPPVSSVLPSGIEGPYIFATLHRAELTDQPGMLRSALETLGTLPLPVVLALHPRTAEVLARQGETRSRIGRLTLIGAVGYLESLTLTRSAALVVTDSGGVQREAYWLGVPCITLRSETEWMGTVRLGANWLVPPERAARDLSAAVDQQLARWNGKAWDRHLYGDGRAADQIGSAIDRWLSATASPSG